MRNGFFLGLTMMALLPLIGGGCASFSQNKKAAVQRYEVATARAKLPLAREFYENNKPDDALKVLNHCLAVDPDNAQANLLMGEIQLSQGRNGIARQYLNKAVEQEDSLHQAWAWLGVIALEAQNPKQAVDYQSKALQRDPLNLEYILSLSETYSVLGQYDLADKLLGEKVRALPGQSKLLVAQASIRNRSGDLPGAIQQYRRALVLDEHSPEIMEALGYCYITQENWPAAMDMFDRVTEKYEGSRKTACLQMLAMCAMNGGQYGRAVRYYDKLILEQRDNPELWLKMGYAALGAHDSKRAGVCARRALDLRPAWDKATALQGCAQYMENDFARAVETFRWITSSKETGGFAWLMMGRCYQQLGQTDKAEAAYKTAASLNPDSKLVSMLTPSETTASKTEKP